VVITNAGADLTYDSNLNYCNGGVPTDDFTYTLAGGSTATVRVTVTCADDPSVAVDDTATVAADAAATTINVRANDTDIEDGFTTELIASVTQPANGTVVITNAGADLTYDSNLNYCNGGVPTDDFTYTLAGGSTATVRVTVTCVNDEPGFTAANPPAVNMNAGAQTLVGWVTGFDPGPANESSQGVDAYLVANNACGSLLSAGPSVNAAGTLTYTPANDQSGTCDFDVSVRDNGGTSNGGDDTSPAQTFTITINDDEPPVIVTNGINSVPPTDDNHISEREIVFIAINRITVTFSEDMFNPAGNADPDDVTNPANYRLLKSDDETFATLSCAGGVIAPDIAIPINSVAYDNNNGAGPFIATLTFNNGSPLPTGFYRLLICGTTSVEDLAGNKLAGDGLNAGTDFNRNFIMFVGGGGGGGGGSAGSSGSATIPVTGFAPNRITAIQGPRVNYANSGVTIELPRLKVTLPIVGVPFKNGGWDVNWLTSQAGWLEQTAFPGLNGNSVITSHIVSRYGAAGPFANLAKLVVGDMVYLRNNGALYIYQVEKVYSVNSNDTSIFKHEAKPWLTLVTCAEYDELTQTYRKRVVVRARLIGTQADPNYTP
jgi:LPXTG-site transpeptidase (sortase) family protein